MPRGRRELCDISALGFQVPPEPVHAAHHLGFALRSPGGAPKKLVPTFHFFSEVYFSRGSLPPKGVRKGTTGGPSKVNSLFGCELESNRGSQNDRMASLGGICWI